MRKPWQTSGGGLLIVQAAGVLLVPLALMLMPPARGAMLLVPFGGANAVAFARTHDATLVRSGPLPGSIVVVGTSAALAGDPLHILALAAAPIACGSVELAA